MKKITLQNYNNAVVLIIVLIHKINLCHFTQTNVDYGNDGGEKGVLSDFLKVFTKVVPVTTIAGRLFQILAATTGSRLLGRDQQAGSWMPCHDHIEKPATSP